MACEQEPLNGLLTAYGAHQREIEALTAKRDQLQIQAEELTQQLLLAQSESAQIRRDYLHEKWGREKAERQLDLVRQALDALVPAAPFDPAIPKTLGALANALQVGISREEAVKLLSRYGGESRKRVLVEAIAAFDWACAQVPQSTSAENGETK